MKVGSALRLWRKREEKKDGDQGSDRVMGSSIAGFVPRGWVVKDFYEVIRGCGYVVVAFDEVGRGYYIVVEPVLVGREPELLLEVKERLVDELELGREAVRGGEEVRRSVAEAAMRIARSLGCKDERVLRKIAYYAVRDTVGLGPIEVIYHDPKVEDILCDGVRIPIFVFHRDYEWLKTNVEFVDEEDLNRFVRRLALRSGHDISIANPIVEGSLPPAGYRAHLTLGVVSRHGSTFTIRKFRAEPFTLSELVRLGTLSPELAAYFWLLMDKIVSMLICGAMASGKTTMLNAVAMTIRSEAKIVTIEDTPEIRLPHENWVPMVTRPSLEAGVREITLYDLLKSALRQRPDYIIVGEIRGEEAYTFFQAVAVGHGGLGTVHGESIESVIRRLESPPMNVPRGMIPLVKAFVLMGRVRTRFGLVRRVIEVQEVVGLHEETGEIILNKIYEWDSVKDAWRRAERSYILEEVARREGVPYSDVVRELERRAVVMKWMAWKGITRFNEFMEILDSYRADPEKVYRTAEVELSEQSP